MIGRALLHLGFSPDDFVVEDNGSGPRIARWLSATPQPTGAEIAAAAAAADAKEAQDAQDRATLATLRDQVKSAISALDTIQRAPSFTAQQRDDAIRAMAQIIERFIRVVMEQAR